MKHSLQQRTPQEQETMSQSKPTEVYLIQDQFDPYIQGRDHLPSYSSLINGQEYTPSTHNLSHYAEAITSTLMW